MQNFGINLLATAQTVIRKQTYEIKLWLSRDTADSGYDINTYDFAVSRQASVQPLSAQQKQILGLAIKSTYITIFDLDLIKLLDREINPPQIIYLGYYWQPIPSSMDWNDSGGWNQVTAIRQAKVKVFESFGFSENNNNFNNGNFTGGD